MMQCKLSCNDKKNSKVTGFHGKGWSFWFFRIMYGVLGEILFMNSNFSRI